jgi:hypothetical protein
VLLVLALLLVLVVLVLVGTSWWLGDSGAGGRVLLAADRAGFSVAAESCSYEGPLRLEVSLLPCAAVCLWLWCGNWCWRF